MIVYIASFSALVTLYKISAKQEGHIVGGQKSNIKDYPHSAFLQVNFDDKAWICGSSILNQVIILTAAHCVYHETGPKYNFIVHVGSRNRWTGKQHKVKTYRVHENYGDSTLDNDIALLKLRVPLKLSETVRRIILMKNPPHDNYGYVAGWGLVDEINHVYTDVIRSAKQRLWDFNECARALGQLPYGVICGGDLETDIHAAPGDSGSALVIRKFIQVGLVSFKKPSTSQSLVVYTDVAYHYNWILTTVKKLYCPRPKG